MLSISSLISPVSKISIHSYPTITTSSFEDEEEFEISGCWNSNIIKLQTPSLLSVASSYNEIPYRPEFETTKTLDRPIVRLRAQSMEESNHRPFILPPVRNRVISFGEVQDNLRTISTPIVNRVRNRVISFGEVEDNLRTISSPIVNRVRNRGISFGEVEDNLRTISSPIVNRVRSTSHGASDSRPPYPLSPPLNRGSSLDFPNGFIDINKKRVLNCSTAGCGRTFKSKSHLLRHERMHTGEKPFACLWQNCDKRFSRRDNMTQHYSTHLQPSAL